MREQVGNQVRRGGPNPYATREDFVDVFREDMNGLCHLSYLVTPVKARSARARKQIKELMQRALKPRSRNLQKNQPIISNVPRYKQERLM